MKKVLIIGAKGMLGQELVQAFGADKKYKTVGWDLDEIDITEEVQVKRKISSLAPKIIINAAAYNAVDAAEEPAGFELAKKINGLAPGYLAQVARKLGAVFVHYSTDYVFSGRKIGGYKENDVLSPVSNYGRSKLLGEQRIQRAGGYFYIIRLQKLFGRPARSAGAKKSFFEIMLKLAKSKKKIEVVDEELANFTYAPDIAVRTRDIIEGSLPVGIYHIINEGRPVTWFGAAKILFEAAKIKNVDLVPVSASQFSRAAKRPKYSILINSKLQPLRPWTEALMDFLNSK